MEFWTAFTFKVFDERFIAVTNIENIDVAFLIANETRVVIGDWNPEITEFKRL